MDFTERSDIEKGFAEVFHRDVKPRLMEIEETRVEKLAKSRRGGLISLGVGAGVGLIVAAVFGFAVPAVVAGIVILVLGIIAALAIRSVNAKAWKGSVAEAVMPSICDHVGEVSYDAAAAKGFPVGEMRALGLVGSYDNARLSDRVEGRHRGTAFSLVEAYLTKRSRDSDGKTKTTTVFRGLLFDIEVPAEAPGRIVIMRDYGALGNKLGAMFSGKKGRGMPRVETGHEAFEAAFEVHADQPDAARDFLPHGFLDNLLSIAETEGGSRGTKAMICGFEGRSFYMALSRGGDFLRMGSLSTPVTEMEDDLHAIFDDLDLVRRVIDRLHGVG